MPSDNRPMNADEPSTDSKAELIAERYLERLQAGEEPDEAEIVGSNPQAAPALVKRMKVFKLLHNAARRLATGAASSIELPLRCPHCGHAFSSVGAETSEVVCPSCNSNIHLDRGASGV